MIIVCSRHGLVQTARPLRALCQTCTSAPCYYSTILRTDNASPSAPTQLATEEPPVNPRESSVGVADPSARPNQDGDSRPLGQTVTHTTSEGQHQSDTLYHDVRHQLQLRSTSDVLRRSFYRSSAIVRSNRMTTDFLEFLESRQHKAFTRVELGHRTVAQQRPNLAGGETEGSTIVTENKPVTGSLASGNSDTSMRQSRSLSSSRQQSLLDLPDGVRADRPAILGALISAQLDGCQLPADVLRVYVTALQNPDATEALNLIQYKDQQFRPWFSRLGHKSDVVRVLSTVIRRLEGAGVHVSPYLLEAGVLRSAQHGNLDGLWRFLHRLKGYLNTGVADQNWTRELLKKLLSSLKHAALARQSKKYARQDHVQRLREIVYGPVPSSADDESENLESASTPKQRPQEGEGYAIRTFFNFLDFNTRDFLAHADYILLLGLSELLEPVTEAWKAYIASAHHAATRTNPDDPIMRAFIESFAMLDQPELVWQALRASDFRVSETDAIFELRVLRPALSHSSSRDMIDELSPAERKSWQRRTRLISEALEHEVSARLEPSFAELERMLRVRWSAADGKHILDPHAAKLYDEELGRDDALSTDAGTVLQRLVAHVWGREGEDAVQEVQQLEDEPEVRDR